MSMCVLICLLTSCAASRSDRESAALPEDGAPALQVIGERAEGILLAVPAQDWPRVYAYIRDIDSLWQDYKRPTSTTSEPRRFPTGLLFGDLDAAVAGLKWGAAARDSRHTLRAAGDLSGAVAALAGYSNPERPSGIHRLAVLQTQIAMESAEGNLTAASRNFERLRGTWGQVRPTVRTRAGDVVVQGVDQLLAEQQVALQAGNPSWLASSARDTLQMINDLQQLTY